MARTVTIKGSVVMLFLLLCGEWALLLSGDYNGTPLAFGLIAIGLHFSKESK